MTGQTKKAFWLHYLQNLVGVFGLVISAYGLFVELYSAQNPHCKPMCVLHEYFSCSTALNSRFGTGLGLIGPIFGDDHVLNQKNAAYGFVTYTLLLILGKFTSIRAARIYYWITIVLNIMTVYLSVVLVYLQTLCLVCIAIYIINGILLLLAKKKNRLTNRNCREKAKLNVAFAFLCRLGQN